MRQAIGLVVIGASALVLWAGVTNAGGKDKNGRPIPTLGQQIGSVLRGGKTGRVAG